MGYKLRLNFQYWELYLHADAQWIHAYISYCKQTAFVLFWMIMKSLLFKITVNICVRLYKRFFYKNTLYKNVHDESSELSLTGDRWEEKKSLNESSANEGVL